MENFTVTQAQRLIELNAKEEIVNQTFENIEQRNNCYREIESKLVKENKGKLDTLMHDTHKPLVIRVEQSLESWLTQEEEFTRVATPVIITSDMLAKMTITEEHHLRDQVFWIDNKKCLRPMLAPNLYEVMRDLYKITGEPVRIFEAGSCFRKESQGARHMNEFTMLNLVELDSVKDGDQMERLERLAEGAMKAVGIDKYSLVKEKSGVYNETVDIEVEGLEIASGAFGPHPLDAKWGIFEPWVGLGLGLERIAMIKGEYQTIKRAGKSIAYLDGVPLKL